MSEFTQFDHRVSICYDPQASKKLGKDYFRVNGFRYYLHYYGSSEYVDIPNNYLSDGATIPKLLWPLLPPWGEYTQNVVLHDYLCDVMEVKIKLLDGTESSRKITRREVDHIFFESCEVTKVTPWKLNIIKAGVNSYRTLFNPKRPSMNKLKWNLINNPPEGFFTP